MVFTWGHSLRLRGARQDPEVQISVLAHIFRGKDQRKNKSLQPKLRQDFVVWMSVPAHRFD